MTGAVNFMKRLYGHRRLIKAMAVEEIQRRYAGTLAGFVWSIINPVITILVYWFVFSVGLKVKPMGDVPFIVFFAVGLVPWLTFSETVSSGANCVVTNAYLVKKMAFPTEILSFVTLTANLIIHFVMVLIVLAVVMLNGGTLTLLSLQFVYYLFALSVFCVGLSWFISAVNTFHRDAGLMLGVILNIWFWLTPIVYGLDALPERYRRLMHLNPLLYIVEGYRKSFIYNRPFWEDYGVGAYFWAVTLVILLAGAFVFRRLKPEFADVL